MPNKKILVVLILCLAIITSVWIFERGTTIEKISSNIGTTTPSGDVVVIEARPEVASSFDWQKTLSSVHPYTTTLISPENGVLDDTTLTGQLAQDSFGRYLLAVKNGDGNPIPDDQSTQIAMDTLSSSNYTTVNGPHYIDKNLHIVPSTETTRQAYLVALQKTIMAHKSTSKIGALNIVTKAVNNQNSDELKSLNTLITNYEAIISDLLTTQVPDDAVFVHLDFLNALSNVDADTKAMKASIIDPVKGLASINLYIDHTNTFSLSMKKMDIYFKTKGLIK